MNMGDRVMAVPPPDWEGVDNRRIPTYEEGLRDGQIKALEAITARHDERIQLLEGRMSMQERVQWGLLGAIALIEILPNLRDFLS